jgi:hypothetical protein
MEMISEQFSRRRVPFVFDQKNPHFFWGNWIGRDIALAVTKLGVNIALPQIRKLIFYQNFHLWSR